MLAKQLDKATLIRSMSYTPNGPLQSHRRHLPDDDRLHARPRVALRPARAARAERFPAPPAATIAKLKPPEVADAARSSMLPRPLQESNVIGKGGTAGFLGTAYDPTISIRTRPRTIKTRRPALRKEMSHGTPQGPRRAAQGHQRVRCPTWKRRSRTTRSTSIIRRPSTSSSPARRATPST